MNFTNCLTSQRDECPNSFIAEEDPCPDHHAENDRRVEWIADPHVSGSCAAKIACQQDRAKNGSTRNGIDDSTKELEDADANNDALGISEPGKFRQDRSRLHQLHDSAE